jgi:hypothetical protein
LTTVQNLIDNGHISPTSFGLAFRQLIKAYESTMVNAAIMKKQYDELFAANEKEKKKRQRSKKRIQHSGGITREEAQELIRSRDEATGIQSRDEATGIQINNAVQSTTGVSQPRQRAPPTCSNCHTVGHKRTQCPEPTSS